jgi:DNA-binding MarR family transcriptional regulator
MRNAGTDRIAAALDQLVIWSRRAVPVPVSASQFTTLETLHRDGPLRVSELAVREQLTQPGMTILLNRLEADGLARRIADPTDRRATLVEITAAGAELVETRHASRRAVFAAQVQRLAPAEQAALEAAVEAIQAIAATRTRDLTEMKVQ